MPDNVAEILDALSIRDFDKDIFRMSKDELYEHFSFATSGNFKHVQCIRNLIWQDYSSLQSGRLELSRGNIRSYWYARVKPVVSRAMEADELSKTYDTTSGELKSMVVDHRLFDYIDFGFADHKRNNRTIGGDNRYIFCVAEKSGHFPLLEQFHRDYDITIVSLGGQPSSLSSEYLLRELFEIGFDPSEPIPLFTIVDYDPSGDSIVRSFIWQMTALGFPVEFERIDLAHPSRMTEEQISLNKYDLPGEPEDKKNRQWAARTHGLEPYGHSAFCGLQADAMTWAQLRAAFDDEVTRYLDISKEQIIRRRLKRDLIGVTKELLLYRILGW